MGIIHKSTGGGVSARKLLIKGVNTAFTPTLDYEPATKKYVDEIVVGLLDDRGNYNASVNTFPAAGGSGTAGAILKGDLWFISAAGTLGSSAVEIGDQIRALSDAPGQTAANWAISQANITYTPENAANKVTSISGSSTDTQYPSAKLVYDQFALKAPLFSPTFSGTAIFSRTGLNGIGPAAAAYFKTDAKTANDANDFYFQSKNSADTYINYGGIRFTIITPTAGSENSTLNIYQRINGAYARVLHTDKNGNVGLYGVTAPTAKLHIAAGTATAGTAPFKFTLTNAVLLTVPEAGVLEPDATGNLFFTDSTGVRYRLVKDTELEFPEHILNTTGNQNIVAGKCNKITPESLLTLTASGYSAVKGAILIIYNGFDKINFSANIHWTGTGTPPVLQATGTDIIQLVSYDGADIIASHIIGYPTESSSS